MQELRKKVYMSKKGEKLYQNMLAKGSYLVENRTSFPERAAKQRET